MPNAKRLLNKKVIEIVPGHRIRPRPANPNKALILSLENLRRSQNVLLAAFAQTESAIWQVEDALGLLHQVPKN